MNLEFTTNEYFTLLKAVYLADCVANGQAEWTGHECREISRLRRKIFAAAKEAGHADVVRHDPGTDDFTETDAFADEMDAEFFERHVDGVFWRELASRFAEKVMDDRFGAEMTGWSDEKYKKIRTGIEKRIEAEIQANGLKNFFLLGDFS